MNTKSPADANREAEFLEPTWDGTRFVFSEVRAEWAGSKLLVRHEQITSPRAWRDKYRDHTVIINLGGSTTAFEAELDDGMRSVQPPTRGYMSIIPAGRAFAGNFRGTSTRYAIWEMTEARLHAIAEDCGFRGFIELVAALSHNDEVIFTAISQLAEIAGERPAHDFHLIGDTISHTLGRYLLEKHTRHAASYRYPTDPTAKLTRREISRIQEFINANLDGKLRLEQIAGVVQRSVNELLISFREHFGMTPRQYVIKERLKRARWELVFTSKPISAVAYDAGFASQSHLTSAFSRQRWMPPAAFRANERSLIREG